MGTSEPIRKILIAGGGTAGWMTAAYLQHFLRPGDCEITLVESELVKSIGVGEATLPALVRFIRTLGYDEAELMAACNATYKLGVKFIDWSESDVSYWHPFGICGGYIDGIDIFHHWNTLRIQSGIDTQYSDYSLQALLAESAKFPFTDGKSSFLYKAGAYAYHIDAGLFAEYLMGKATAAGVRHIRSGITAVETDNSGHIISVSTGDGSSHYADLFIDCTGFRALFMEDQLQVPWIDWNSSLLCDRAVVLPRPRPARIAPFTRSTAMEAGWCWTIPLQHREGYGYVYSSSHKEDDDAATELLEFCGEDSAHTDVRHLQMRIGHRQDFWRGNCVAIGLSGGFIEPLESTGIYLIQQGIESLMDNLPAMDFNPVLMRTYNDLMTVAYEEIRDFILLHYLPSRGGLTAFWNDCRHVPVPDSVSTLLALYRETGNLPALKLGVFPEASYYHILAGNGLYPSRPLPQTRVTATERVAGIFQEITDNNAGYVTSMPSYTGWLENNGEREAVRR